MKRQFLAVLAAAHEFQKTLTAIMVVGLVTGCGGGGAGGSTPKSTSKVGTAAGSVSLPTGFAIPLSRLAIATDAGQVPLSKAGTFSVPVSSAGPRLAQLIDTTTNKLVLLGYVDSSPTGSPYAGGKGQVTSATTAAVLLFLGLSGPQLPIASWQTYQTSIATSGMTATVAATVASSVAKNPTALSDGDPAILSALEAVQATAVSPPAEVHKSGKPFSVARVTVQRPLTPTGDALVSVTPNEEQSGMEVAPNPKGQGIVFVNNIRRRASVFVYEVAKGQTPSTVVRLPKPVETVSGQGLSPQEALDSVTVSVFNGLRGKFSFLSEESEPIILPPDGASPVTVYDVVVIGPGINDTIAGVAAEVAPGDPAEQVSLAIEWNTAETVTITKSIALDVILPLGFYLALEGGESEEAISSPELTANVESLISSLKDVTAAIASRNLKLATQTFFKDIIQSPDLKASLVHIITTFLVENGVPSGPLNKALERLASAATVMGDINAGFLSVDIGRLFRDSTSYDQADEWVATALLPKITLSPNPATVNDIQNIAILSVQIQGETDLSKFRFQWSTSGTEGSLQEPTASIPMPTIITSFSQTAYVANLSKLKSGTFDTVQVTVYSSADLSKSIGTATAVVKAQPGLESGSFSIDSTDVFPGIVKNDPWVLSAVVTCPFVKAQHPISSRLPERTPESTPTLSTRPTGSKSWMATTSPIAST
jgi:hypothetical protein